MTCHESIDLLPSYVLGNLTTADAKAVEDHLQSGCETCRRELSELREAIAVLAEMDEPVVPPHALKQDVLNRVRTAGEQTDSTSPSTVPFPAAPAEPSVVPATSPNWGRFIAHAATLLLAVALGALAASFFSEADELAKTREEQSKDVADWRRQIDQTERALGSPATRLVSLDSATDEAGISSQLLFDELSGQLHVYLIDAPAVEEGKQHVVWALDEDDQPVAHKKLLPQGSGRESAVLNVSRPTEQALAIVITTESTEPAPTEPSDDVLTRLESKPSS